MKTFNVKLNGKSYNVKAKDAQHAAKLVKMVVKDEIIRYKGAKIEKVNSSSKPYMIVGFGEAYSSIDEAKRAVDEWIDQGIRFRDAASPLQTVNALLEDERAAVDAYNVALENLKGKIPDESYEAIEAIRNDENRHIENLQAVVNGNVTEKNLTDSTMEDDDAFIKSDLMRAIRTIESALKDENWQMIANVGFNIYDRLKRLGLAK